MNIPVEIARAQGHHGWKGAEHGHKGAAHGRKGGRPSSGVDRREQKRNSAWRCVRKPLTAEKKAEYAENRKRARAARRAIAEREKKIEGLRRDIRGSLRNAEQCRKEAKNFKPTEYMILSCWSEKQLKEQVAERQADLIRQAEMFENWARAQKQELQALLG